MTDLQEVNSTRQKVIEAALSIRDGITIGPEISRALDVFEAAVRRDQYRKDVDSMQDANGYRIGG
jgi:hypothetical protein